MKKNELMQVMQERIESLERNQAPKRLKKQTSSRGVVYVIVAWGNMKNIFKLGRTIDLTRRLMSHSSASADNLKVMFVFETDCVEAVESCAKAMLKEHKYRKYKEVYQADLSMIKKVIAGCGAVCNTLRRGRMPPSEIQDLAKGVRHSEKLNERELYMVFDNNESV